MLAAVESSDSIFEQWSGCDSVLGNVCTVEVSGAKNENFIKLPTPDHMVLAEDSMDKVFHLFVVGRHDSLFVTDGKAIVGVIRFSDVYRKIVHTMRECPLPQ